MTDSSYDQLLEQARSLPESQRVQLVEAIIETLEPEDAAPLDDAWLEEIARRSDEFDAGLVQPVAWDEVKRRARQRCQPHG